MQVLNPVRLLFIMGLYIWVLKPQMAVGTRIGKQLSGALILMLPIYLTGRARYLLPLLIMEVEHLLHDWADIGITNGVLYDFDGAGVTTQKDVYEYNLLTGATTHFPLPAGYTPGQTGVGWNDNVYQVYALATGPINPYIAPYNKGLGTEGARTNIFSVPAYTPAIPSLGDAGEAFRPLMDFGDAPAIL